MRSTASPTPRGREPLLEPEAGRAGRHPRPAPASLGRRAAGGVMPFVIHARDREGALPLRLALYEARKTFLADTSPFGVNIVMSGPLAADDGATMIGSLFVVDAPDRASVESFHAAD